MRNGSDELYTMQDFLCTAQRRVREARALLNYPERQKQRDGAVTMALLAAECALKATLLYGFQLNTTGDASEIQFTRWFKGKAGHNLKMLWSDQNASLRVMSKSTQDEAVRSLSCADPYSYRYGKKKPKVEHAEPFVVHSEILVRWTENVMGVS